MFECFNVLMNTISHRTRMLDSNLLQFKHSNISQFRHSQFKHSSIQTFKHFSIQTFPIQTFLNSNIQTFPNSNILQTFPIQTFKHSSIQTFKHFPSCSSLSEKPFAASFSTRYFRQEDSEASHASDTNQLGYQANSRSLLPL